MVFGKPIYTEFLNSQVHVRTCTVHVLAEHKQDRLQRCLAEHNTG